MNNIAIASIRSGLEAHKERMAGKSRMQIVRSIQQSRNEEPCFATVKNYCCGKDCEWREDCRDMVFSMEFG